MIYDFNCNGVVVCVFIVYVSDFEQFVVVLFVVLEVGGDVVVGSCEVYVGRELSWIVVVVCGSCRGSVL